MYGKGKGGKEIRTVRTGGEGKKNVWEGEGREGNKNGKNGRGRKEEYMGKGEYMYNI